jgi:aarF domain-containing kinase
MVVRRDSSVALQHPIAANGGSSGDPSSMWSRIAVCSMFVGVGTLGYRYLRRQQKQVPAAAIIDIPRPSDKDFSHPFETESWLFRLFVCVKRMFILSCLFVPCAAVGVVAKITEDESWREYFLDMLVWAFECAGCGFQKFGQWMSMRPDMFPPDVIHAMEKLRQEVPAHSHAHTKKMIKDSFGKDIEDIFEWFDETPIASGTIAQVHKAIIRPEYSNNGQRQEVAVKVRHPSVLEETFVDLDFIFHFMNQSKIFVVPFARTQFIDSLQKQIDLEWEAHSLSKFAKNFKQEIMDGELSFPFVFPKLLSSSVLVESWANGGSVSRFFSEVGDGFKSLQKIGESFTDNVDRRKKLLADKLFSVCMKMFLRDNYMHGDLHAGNILFDESTSRITVLDAGHTTSLQRENTSSFGVFLHAMCSGNADRLYQSLIDMHVGDKSVVNAEGLKRDVFNAVNKFVGEDGRGHDGSPVCVGDVMGEILFRLRQNGVALPGDVALSLVSIAISEGLIRQLDPAFDLNHRALPFLAKYGAGFASSRC